MNSPEPLNIDHLAESLFELEGALYLYREAMAARFRQAGDGSARAEQVEELRAQVRASVGDLRGERAKRAQLKAQFPGAWTAAHFARLDSLLGNDIAHVKRIVSVIGFDD